MREEAKAALYLTVHGAGRLFGRKEAIRTFTKPQMDGWLQERGVTLSGGGIDESPMAYRRRPEVLAHHAASTKVLHTNEAVRSGDGRGSGVRPVEGLSGA